MAMFHRHQDAAERAANAKLAGIEKNCEAEDSSAGREAKAKIDAIDESATRNLLGRPAPTLVRGRSMGKSTTLAAQGLRALQENMRSGDGQSPSDAPEVRHGRPDPGA